MRLKKLLLSIGVLLPLAVLPYVAVWQRQNITDWYRLRDYTPPARVAELATNIGLTDYGRKLFYVNYPELNDKESFRVSCNRSEESIVLGCYIGNDNGIHILDVQDERLAGIHEVTAAHEMLHAAYDRLSPSERSSIDRLTEEVYASLNNERIRETVENYRQRDPDVVPNELHSILATEVRDLPAELEAHYLQYFDDRLEIVEYSEQYEQIFIEQEDFAESLKRRIDGLKQEINGLEEDLLRRKGALDAERGQVNTNAEVTAFNRRVDAFNDDIVRVGRLVDEHNRLVEEYRELELTRQDLLEAIDSRLKPTEDPAR